MGLKIKTKDKKSVIKFVNSLKLFGYGYSWGGFESLAIDQRKGERGNRIYSDIKEDEKIEQIIDENNNTVENQDPIEKTPLENKIEKDKKEKRYPAKRYKIQEVIKPNQVILIQVLKDERGLKGAALSTFISIAGKYIVLMPNTPKGGGISRKIFNSGERKKIRSILNEITIPKEMGLIVRTAGSNKSKNEIDYFKLPTRIVLSLKKLQNFLVGRSSRNFLTVI